MTTPPLAHSPTGLRLDAPEGRHAGPTVAFGVLHRCGSGNNQLNQDTPPLRIQGTTTSNDGGSIADDGQLHW